MHLYISSIYLFEFILSLLYFVQWFYYEYTYVLHHMHVSVMTSTYLKWELMLHYLHCLTLNDIFLLALLLMKVEFWWNSNSQ